MQVTVTAKDTLTADLLRTARGMSAEKRREAMDAVGLGLVSMAKRAFNTDTSLRPAPWVAKKDGSPSTLQKSTRLRNSIKHGATADTASVFSDAKYAAIHQLGGQTKAHIIRPKFKKALAFGGGVFAMVRHPGSTIPARPYFPFHATGLPTEKADRMCRSVLTKKLFPADRA